MEPTTPMESEFIFRRLFDPLSPWALALPIGFAFGVLLLITLFRRENRWSSFLISSAVLAAISVVYLFLGLNFISRFSWFVILVPVLAVALFYVGMMYQKDAQTVAWGWAAFLGFLRCMVYAILAAVFLLPGCQGFDTNQTHSKIIFFFDVSDSMLAIDDIPAVGQDETTLRNRQQKILDKYFSDPAFLQKFCDKSKIEFRRFGKVLDELTILRFPKDLKLVADGKPTAEWNKTRGEIEVFLFPDVKQVKREDDAKMDEKDKKEAEKLFHKRRDMITELKTGTNLGGALMTLARQEANSFLQAVYIFSDGQSNVGGDETLRDFSNRVSSSKKTIHVVTIGAGDYRQPVKIRIDPIAAPEWARPDDKFIVKVPVVGDGLQDRPFECTLEMVKVTKTGDNEQEDPATLKIVDKKAGMFKGGGESPRDEIEFDVDMVKLFGFKSADEDKTGQMEGTWRFRARVPRAEGEPTAKKEHVSEDKPPVDVLVQKRQLRILLFAGGPSREYQFLRTVLYREVLAKKYELAVYLQTGRDDKGGSNDIDQDVEGDWFLTNFPITLAPSGEKKQMSLSSYDVIIAIDPDWTALTSDQLKNVEQWVGATSGGLIFVSGPVHTFHLARPGGVDLSSLTAIYPVHLKDSRLQGLGIDHDPTRPYYLEFSKAAVNFDFLRLDESGDAEKPNPIQGWDRFFWGDSDRRPEPGKDMKPINGFHTYYPIEKLKPASVVIASFIGPKTGWINDGRDPPPFIVTMPYGQGKTMHLGASEFWRLRQAKGGETLHERFWKKLVKYMSAGKTEQKKYGYISLAREGRPGNLQFDAKLLGDDLKPLAQDSAPVVKVKVPAEGTELREFTLKPKPLQGPWTGWFQHKYAIKTPGVYQFTIDIPGVGPVVEHSISISEPDLESRILKNNFGPLYQIATPARGILDRARDKSKDADKTKDVELLLKASAAKVEAKDQKDELRLFFDFPKAHGDILTKIVVEQKPDIEHTKSKLTDLWDTGLWDKDDSPFWADAYWLSVLTPLAVGIVALLILLLMQRYIEGGIALAIGAAVGLLMMFVVDRDIGTVEVNLSVVLGTVVGLLSIEWLTRKLLKLA